jgi:hypothetical protein
MTKCGLVDFLHTFRTIILPPFSESKKELSNFQEGSTKYLLVCHIFYPEDGGSRVSVFSSIPLENCCVNTSIKSCPLPIKSFPVHHSMLNILGIDSVSSGNS